MEAYKGLAAVVVSVIRLSLVSSECRIDASSSSSPYLVRIFECSQPNPDWAPLANASECLSFRTLAHGSLLSADKVLTTCTWMDNRYQVLAFRIYNTKSDCWQERFPLTVIAHPNCEQVPTDDRNGQNFMVNDVALWIMESPFDVDIKVMIWGGEGGGIGPPDVSKMRRTVETLNKGSTTCKAVQFRSDTAVDAAVDPDSNLKLIPWKNCLAELERIFPVDDDPNNKPLRKVGSHVFACFQDERISGFRFAPPQEIGYDWRSGTAVLCEAEGKKVPVGMLSRIVAPAPWAKASSFRMAVLFHSKIYDFMVETIGVNRMPQDENYCKLSGEYHYPYLLRITREQGGFDPVITVGHGAVLKKNMVLSSCTSYRKLPQDLSNDKKWAFVGYNLIKRCSQMRKPVMLYKHPDCAMYDEDQVMANDFAIWVPDREFAFDWEVLYPNLWQGPNRPPLNEVVRSILELSDDEYVGIISRRLSVGIFLEPKLVTGDRQINAEVLFVPWEECKEQQLGDMVPNVDDVKLEYVVDKMDYPVFCGIENFISAGPQTNASKADWYSGAIVMYSFLYVWEWGKEPKSVTYPIGILSRAIVGQAKPDGRNIRLIAGFTKGFEVFLRSIENEALPKYYQSQLRRNAGQPLHDTPTLFRLTSVFCTVVAFRHTQ